MDRPEILISVYQAGAWRHAKANTDKYADANLQRVFLYKNWLCLLTQARWWAKFLSVTISMGLNKVNVS